MRWLASPGAVPRTVVLACVLIAAAAALVRYPDAISELTRTARDNASQSFADREIAGGNAVIPNQELMYQARARIPEDSRFEVAVGEPAESWSDLTEDHAAGYATYFLLPRRPGSNAPWVICLNCDRARYRGETVWSDGEGLSIVRRSG